MNGSHGIRVEAEWIRLVLTLAIVSACGSYSDLRSEEPLGVRVPDGFEVSLYADDDLAHDIYSMTIDSFGRVVVSGAGYVKVLLDTDQDGRADQASLFVDGPKAGLQGMYFAGPDLICSGEGGLIRYRDRNGDDHADGPPDLFWKIKTGGEHDLHAIRKGPDGWWYVIAGNNAGIDDRFVKTKTSPVQHPQAGALLRFSPDLTSSEVYSDGFRNAYDFDFGDNGDLFSFDSDGERDISLPWYRPTRVFHLLAGSHVGWFTRSWKRPDSFFDMPPVVGAFGRGSPTGVECYRHTQFPPEYHGALFVLDWTYGRVMALPLQQSGSTYEAEPIEFMTAIGQHGFAPTDAAVGPDGSLYISVGGRGTRGGVYRIRARVDARSTEAMTFGQTIPPSASAQVELCLNAPQPLSSWSRRVWEPIVAGLEKELFKVAASDLTRSDAQRVRAIEILTEKFDGVDLPLAQQLVADSHPRIRARVAWSIGRTQTENPPTDLIAKLLSDEAPHVARMTAESLLGAEPGAFQHLIQPLGKQLARDDRFVRQATMRLLAKCDNETVRKMATTGYQQGPRAAIPVAAAYTMQNPGFQAYPIEIAQRLLHPSVSTDLRREAARVLQLGLGDLVPGRDEIDPVYDGYAGPVDLSHHTSTLNSLTTLLEQLYPSGDAELDTELERIMAMIESPSSQLLDRLVTRINADSHPVEDLHRLIVVSRMTASRSPEQRQQIAFGLVNIEQKIAARNLRQDSNWADRTLEMYNGLVRHDPEFPLAVLRTPGFGHPGHVQLVSQIPPEAFDEAIAAFSQQARANPDYAWNADVIILLATSIDAADQALVRAQFDDFALRPAVVMSLASDPQEKDREYFFRALDSANVETMQECVQALGLLSATEDPAENVALARTLRPLREHGEERQLRDQVIELLQRNLRTRFGYAMGRDGDPQTEQVAEWINFVRERFPEEFAAQSGDDLQGLDALKARLTQINWGTGSSSAGQQLFKSRGCIQCHGGRQALGPDLSGVAGRFSRDDLFTAIAFPDRDVSPRYQTTQIATENGKVHTGLIVYESVDGLVLRDSNNQTYRIETDDIEIRKQLSKSLMPSGLLKGLSDPELSNLYAYLQSLGGPQTAAAERSNIESE